MEAVRKEHTIEKSYQIRKSFVRLHNLVEQKCSLSLLVCCFKNMPILNNNQLFFFFGIPEFGLAAFFENCMILVWGIIKYVKYTLPNNN